MKKLLAILLSVLLLMACVPLGAVSAAAAKSGTTGACRWTLDNSGHLTISGNGAMGNYDETYDRYSPWGTSIVSVTIEKGVTSIGNFAFSSCELLASVTIPDSVISIGEYAFIDCNSLTSMTIPDSVTSIEEEAFMRCENIVSIVIPDSVVSIGDWAFYGTAYYNDATNWENDVLYIGNHLIEATSTLVGSYVTKNKTVTIADYAFEDCASLEEVIISDSITSIGKRAFNDCHSLTSITIPDSVSYIGNDAFYNTAYYNNESNWENDVLYIGRHLINARDTLSSLYDIKDGTLTVAGDAFRDCDSLTSVTIPDSVTSISDYAFSECAALKSVIIGDSVTTIGSSAFYACYVLTSVTIPASVTTIGYDAFFWCNSLTDVYYGGSEADRENIAVDQYNDALLNATWHYNYTPEPDITYGDANGDGSVNARDAALLQQYIAGWDATLDEASADANGDGSVNARDVAMLQQYIAGWDVQLGK